MIQHRRLRLRTTSSDDLGFGTRVGGSRRLLNRDGTFNVDREGLSFWESIDLYHWFLTISWPRFHVVIFAAYILINAMFAGLFLAIGPGALSGTSATGALDRFIEAFFFSVQTFTTVGYGHVAPISQAANVLVVIDTFLGLLGFALATGLMFARFSRPTARIAFSRNAVIAPYRGITAFEFRIANQRRSQLIDLHVRVMMIEMERAPDGSLRRRFHNLPLERERVALFPLTWTIVHPIDEESPLQGLTLADLVDRRVEFAVLLTGTDDVFSQQVQARSSYLAEDLVDHARFSDPYLPSDDGRLHIDLQRLDALIRSEQEDERRTER